MQEVKLPNLGEGIEHGTVVRVRVAPGDSVAPEQTLLELETDKALIEVPSPVAGKVSELRVKEGDTINAGQVILVLDEAAAAAEAAPEAPAQKAEEASSKSEGKPAAKPDEQPAKPQADTEPQAKLELQPETEESTEQEKVAQEGDSKVAGESTAAPVNGQLRSASERLQLPALAAAGFDPQAVAAAAGPATRRMARELGVDLRRVRGSGRGGRVTQEDVRAYVQQAMQDGGPPSAHALPELPDFSRWGAIKLEPLGAVRRTTAEHLSQTWPAVPQVTQFDSADITGLEAMRLRFKPEATERGVHLTATIFLLKALVTALKAQPRFNSSLDLAHGQRILKQYIHIGVAVDTERGLLVPVLRDVDEKDVWQLAFELEAFVKRVREGHVELSELRGASFTLSNQGSIGGTFFTPLVNYPEVAILGAGQARKEPVWDTGAGQVQPRLVLPLALSYDHRALDGADAARFITRVKQSLEDPDRLLLGL